jgi:hypothetical protein
MSCEHLAAELEELRVRAKAAEEGWKRCAADLASETVRANRNEERAAEAERELVAANAIIHDQLREDGAVAALETALTERTREAGEARAAMAEGLAAARRGHEELQRQLSAARANLEQARQDLGAEQRAVAQLRAARDDAERQAKALRASLSDCLAYLWPAPDEGHTGFVDRLGMQFYRETGIWPPFKSEPLEIARDTNREEAQKRWGAWLTVKRDATAAAARAVLSASPSDLCPTVGCVLPLSHRGDCLDTFRRRLPARQPSDTDTAHLPICGCGRPFCPFPSSTKEK